MKIRKGLVSNSSSSSFVLFLDKKPESIEETQKLLFGEEGTFHKYSAKQVAKVVFNDISEAKPFSRERIEEEAGENQANPGWDIEDRIGEYPDFDDPGWGEYAKAWNEMEPIWNNEARETAAKLEAAAIKGEKIMVEVEYSDDCGEFDSTLEHGGTFRKVPHFRISHH